MIYSGCLITTFGVPQIGRGVSVPAVVVISAGKYHDIIVYRDSLQIAVLSYHIPVILCI